MSREHGTSARYVGGPDEHGQRGHGCRCEACKAARRTEANYRDRLIAYGRWQPYVDATPAREHIRMLGRCGIGWQRAARLAGLSTGTVGRLLYGNGRPPSKRVRPETEAAILAVKPSLALVSDRTRIAATGTHRRLRALVAIGWSQERLAARLGMSRGTFGNLMRRQDQVTAATARAVTVLYDELWNQPPPEGEHREKIAASRSRNYARARGWAPGAAWDDERIDDPDAAPEGWQRPARLGSEALVAEVRELVGFGLTRKQAAERLGVTKTAIDKAVGRTRRAA